LKASRKASQGGGSILLASPDLYLRDESVSRAALRQDRKVIGVEMEGYAVMRSASHASVPLGGNASRLALTPERFTAIHLAMNKLRSAALTTTATAYGGSPSGRVR